MTVSLKHAFTSNVADSSDASLVQPSNWNAEHTLTAGADTLLGAVTAGAVTEITCTSAGRALLDDADAAAQRTTLSAAGTGVTNTFTANQIISVTDNTNAALRVTQLGTGDAILVEDSANPDSSPFVVKADGAVGVKTTAPSEALTVNGNAEITSAGFIKMTGRASNGWLLQSVSSGAASEGGLWRTNGSVALSADNVEASFIADKDNLLRFETSYTERMRITDTGAVGIGTSSPLIASGYAWLTINGPSAGAATSWQAAGTENFRIQSTGLGTNLNNITSVPLLLQTNNLERMRIREDGNVGIGTPGANYSKLIIKNDRAVSAYSFVADNYNGVNFENSFVLQYDSTGTQSLGNYQAANLAFLTNNTERMRIAAGGNVGVGTTNPQARLEVVGPTLTVATPSTYAVSIANSGGGATHDLSFGSNASYAYIQSFSGKPLYINSLGNNILTGPSYLGIGKTSPATPLDMAGQFRATDGSVDFRILPLNSGSATIFGTVSTSDLVTYTNNTERMRIGYSGVILMGTSTIGAGRLNISTYQDGTFYGIFMVPTSNTATPLAFTNASQTVIGTITTTSSATFYNTSSDYRLKEKEVSMHDASTRIMSLRPINFAWKSDGSRSDGFLAHEVQAVIPEAVTGKKDAVDADGNPVYQVMDQSRLVPVITAALQDTIKRVSLLERQIESNCRQEQK